MQRLVDLQLFDWAGMVFGDQLEWSEGAYTGAGVDDVEVPLLLPDPGKKIVEAG